MPRNGSFCVRPTAAPDARRLFEGWKILLGDTPNAPFVYFGICCNYCSWKNVDQA